MNQDAQQIVPADDPKLRSVIPSARLAHRQYLNSTISSHAKR